jgi:cell wall-associated NlpC family hydrolase
MYIGNGQMVHAPTSGDVVKIANLDAMGDFVGGRRIAA